MSQPRTLLSASLTLILLAGCASDPDIDARQQAQPPAPETAGGSALLAERSPAAEPVPTDQTDQADRPDVEPASAAAQPAAPAKSARRAIKINLTTQQFTYSQGGQVVRTGPISSGAKGHSTPTGRFAVLDKHQDKVSSRYTNQLGMQAWMPYSVRFHGNYFMHEGWLPGYPDSHGCIRLSEPDARFLFDTLQIGDRVEVVR